VTPGRESASGVLTFKWNRIQFPAESKMGITAGRM